MQYIDALFFASGAATQSGLNTVDLNTILLSQQVFLILIACIANPIWINGMVVFIRLYWFEKRFQKVVRDARTFRRTRTKSRTKSEMKQDLDHDGEERGVGGREIRVLRSPNGDANMNGKKNEDESDSDIAMQGQARGSKMRPGLQSLQTNGHGSPKQTPTSPIAETPSTFQREIVFADEVHPTRNRRRSSAERLPQQRTREQNIAFLERQRQEKAKIRVPGPRDFDRGEMPHKVDDDEEGNMGRSASVDEAHREKQISPGDANELNLDDHPLKSESDSEPHKPSRHLTWLPNVSTVLLPRRSREGGEEDSEMHLRKRGRLGTFNSFLSGRSVEKDRDPIPYLSYAPTIGRNSLFIDLTEDQREELGGVEYRALKTLAWVVTSKFLSIQQQET